LIPLVASEENKVGFDRFKWSVAVLPFQTDFL